MRQLAIVVSILALAGCTTGRAVISDLEEDKVKVQHNAAADNLLLIKTANEGCRIHDRYSVMISTRCLDAYCTTMETLFACQERQQ